MNKERITIEPVRFGRLVMPHHPLLLVHSVERSQRFGVTLFDYPETNRFLSPVSVS